MLTWGWLLGVECPGRSRRGRRELPHAAARELSEDTGLELSPAALRPAGHVQLRVHRRETTELPQPLPGQLHGRSVGLYRAAPPTPAPGWRGRSASTQPGAQQKGRASTSTGGPGGRCSSVTCTPRTLVDPAAKLCRSPFPYRDGVHEARATRFDSLRGIRAAGPDACGGCITSACRRRAGGSATAGRPVPCCPGLAKSCTSPTTPASGSSSLMWPAPPISRRPTCGLWTPRLLRATGFPASAPARWPG